MIFTKNFVLLFISNLLLIMGIMLLLPILPLFSTQVLGLAESHVGIVVSAFAFAALICRPFIGYAVDNLNRKFILLSASVIFTAVFFSYSLVSAIIPLLFLRVAHGISWASFSTTGPAAVTDILPLKKRGEGFGYFSMGLPIAMVAGPALGVLILEHTGSFNLIFYGSAAMGVVGTVFVAILKLPKEKREKKPFILSPFALYEGRSLGISLLQFCFSFSYAGIVTFMPLYSHKTGIGNSGWFFVVYAIGILISRFRVRHTFDLKGPDRLILTGFAFFIMGLIALAFMSGAFLFYFAAAAAGCGAGIVLPTLATMNMNVVPQSRRGKANATLFTAIDIGVGSGAFILGFVIEKLSYTLTYIIVAAILIPPVIWYFKSGRKGYLSYIALAEEEDSA
ncbi:MAG: MFS transporter [Deferribacteraceae bacterium]|jgi:MFS family permease|nr:MFS transporter [Deferribacteraceae bacterium]